jgi:hypothetical protein
MFSEKEIAYLKSQRLGRIATVFNQLQPDVAAVGFDFDGTYSYVGRFIEPSCHRKKFCPTNPYRRPALHFDKSLVNSL